MNATWHIRTQGIPLHSEPQVEFGQWVGVGDAVATIGHYPGALLRVELARALGAMPQSLADYIIKSLGDPVDQGEIIAVNNSFGYPLAARSSVAGSLAQVSRSLGCVYIRQREALPDHDVAVDLLAARRRTLAAVAGGSQMGISMGTGNALGDVNMTFSVNRYSVAVGDTVSRGQELAVIDVPKPGESLPGRQPVGSPCAGIIKAVDRERATVTVEPHELRTVPAAYSGYTISRRTGSIELAVWAERVVGAYGIGGVASGVIHCGDNPPAGAIWVIAGQASLADLERGRAAGVAGIWAASATHADLVTFAGDAQVRSVTGAWGGPVVVLSEGFGELTLEPAVLARLRTAEGRTAVISGQTHLRAGAVRPDLLLPEPQPILNDLSPAALRDWWRANVDQVRAAAHGHEPDRTAWVPGLRVRGMWGQRQGWLGVIASSPTPTTLASGVQTTVAPVKWDSGLAETVPLRNLIAASEEVTGRE